MQIQYSFDGTDSVQTDNHKFLSLAVSDESGTMFGCDCYFDGVGGISEFVDWQDGNGLIAHGILSEVRAIKIATGIIMGQVIENVEAV